MMTKSDLSRTFYLDVTMSGHVFIRERGQPCTGGALPVFSTATWEEAKAIQVLFCRLQYDGTYRLNEVTGREMLHPSALGALSERFRIAYERILAYEARA